MKHFNKVVIILFISLILVSCTKEENQAPKSSQVSLETKTNIIEKKTSVTITGYYEEPESIKDKSTITLGDIGSEYVEIIIQGKVKDFEYIQGEWNNDKNELVEKKTIKRFDNLENTTIVLKTYLPEGIPSEKVKWQSETGKAYEFLIKDNGLADKKDNKQVITLE